MVATYDSIGNPKQSGCASGDCISHECVVRQGYITACLASRCTSAPKPPGPGQIASGPDYVIMTLADADYRDFANAQRLASDSIFESLMPLYCALPRTTNDCVTNRVQWSVRTYNAGGNPFISGCASSGCQDHYCGVLHGYVTAVVRGTNATLPPPGAIGVLAVGTDSVMMTLADGDPSDLVAAQQLATDTVFAALMRVYCALPRGGGPGLVSGAAQWVVANYDANGKPTVSGCASSGCELHTCMVSNGYVTAVLYSGCGAAPEPPQSLGLVAIGPEYVIMTVADADPRDFAKAQQLVPDSIFESLMPLYCSLPQTTNNCLTNRVQWAVRTYDAGGNSLSSGCAASGCRFHDWNPGNPSSPALVISPGSGNRVTISWAPRTPGWVLQETGNYRAGPWSNAPTFGANPVTVPASTKRFYRMSKQ
jgi:hypothetical protein